MTERGSCLRHKYLQEERKFVVDEISGWSYRDEGVYEGVNTRLAEEKMYKSVVTRYLLGTLVRVRNAARGIFSRSAGGIKLGS